MSADIQYIAGILDACAIFRVRETPEGTQLPGVFVHGLPTKILDVLAESTGTKVTLVKRDYHRALCADHCPDRHQHMKSITGRWSVTGAKATVLIHSVLPYLRAQHEEALEVLEVGVAAPRRRATMEKMYELGWPEMTIL